MFCVYLTVYRGNKLPPFYIGQSTVTKIEKGYHGSVVSKRYHQIWKQEIKHNNHLFHTHIIKRVKTRLEATSLEEKFQTQLSAHKNPLYINMSITGKHFHSDCRGRVGRSGWIHSETTKMKMRVAKLGTKQTTEHIENARLTRIGKPKTAEHIEKIRAANKGRIMSAAQKAKLSADRKGKSLSADHKRKMSEWHLAHSPHRKCISDGNTVYESITDAMLQLNYSREKITRLLSLGIFIVCGSNDHLFHE